MTERAPQPPAAWAGFEPGASVRGELRPSGSKSIAQRALVLASLCGEPLRISGLPVENDGSSDVRAARELARACAQSYAELAPAAVRIVGRPPGPARGWNPSAPLAVGESGTLARLALAALSLCGRAGSVHELRPSGTLTRRSSAALVDALVRAGVGLEALGGGDPRATFALRVRPIGPPNLITIDAPRSSQEVSALAIALAAWPDENEIVVTGPIPSRPYLDLTLAVLRRVGVAVDVASEGARTHVRVRGPLKGSASAPQTEAPILVEPDASSAAVALAAACLSGGEIVVPGLGPSSIQGDVRIVDHLRAFGCDASAERESLRARGFPLHGAELDLAATPDLAPVLAALGAAVALRARTPGRESRTHLRGLETLPGKESSRIEVLARGLEQLGVAVEHGADFLAIAPRVDRAPGAALDVRGSPPSSADAIVELDPHGDHRMAFAFALVGLVRAGVRVRDPRCVEKSWPSFWTDLAARGARLAHGD